MPRTIAELRAALAAKEKHVSKLQAERQKVMKQLATLDGEIAALGGRAVKRKPKAAKKARRKTVAKRRRARSQPSLADVLAKVLAGKGGVKVAQARKLALAAGYKSTSSNFGNIVSQALTTDKRFKKVSRGVYALKGAVKTAVKKAAKKVAKKAAKKTLKKAAKKASKKAVKKAGKKAGKRTVKKAVKKAARKVAGGGKKPLAQYLVEALSKASAGMRAMNLAEAALKAGYSTKDKNFKQTVAGMLSTDGRFERVSRGVYKLA